MPEPPNAVPSSRRLFFALWPPDEVRREIRQATAAVVEASRGRAIPLQNLHVTLVFLGHIAERLLGGVMQAGADTHCPPFELKMDRIEAWRRSRILSLTSEQASDGLQVLFAELRRNLLAQHFELEPGELRPHVTLVRNLPLGLRPQQVAPVLWPVNEFVLVESRPLPRGSVYEVIGRWPLAPVACR